MVEYALLLTFVAVPTVVGLTAAGVTLLKNYIAERDHLLYPTP
jgi:Flp pilus assembly pilin Flp